MTARSTRWPLAALAAGALALRGLYLAELWNTPLFAVVFGDGRQYVDWARDLAAGHWLGTSVFYQAPLYPYLLGVLFTATGPSLAAVRVLQAFLGAASCVLLAVAGRHFVGHRAGLAAGWLLAVYAPAIFFDGLIQKSSLDLFLVCALLALLGRASGFAAGSGRSALARSSTSNDRTPDAHPSVRPVLLILLAAGIVLGLFALNRENARVLYPVVAAWIWWYFPDRAPRVRLAWIGAFTAGVVLMLLPVGLRNLAVGGEFLVSTSQAGPNFYIGNHAGAGGSYEPLVAGHGNVAYEREDATRLAEQAVGRPLSPGEVSGYWTRRALADISAHPGAWMALVARKLLLTVNAAEVVDTESLDVYSGFSRVLAVTAWFSFGVLAPLAAAGVWLARGRRRLLALPLAMGATLVVSVAAFYVLARYRFPVVPIAMLLAGISIASLLSWFSGRSGGPGDGSGPAGGRWAAVRSAWPAIALAVGAAIVANVPLAAGGDDTLLNVGEELVRTGRAAEARPFLERAAMASPEYAPARFNLGVALSRLGDRTRALDEFRAAVQLAPADFEAQSALALALQESGDDGGALVHFREAARLRPDDPKARFNLGNALQQDGRAREAVPEYEAALRAKPDYVEALGNLAVALASAGNTDAAAARLEEAARLRPDSAALQFNLAEVLADAGRLGEALPHYERAAALARATGRAEEIDRIETALAGIRRKLK